MSGMKPRIAWIGLDVPVEILSAVGAPFRLDADAASPPQGAAVFAEGGGHPWMRAVTGKLLAETRCLERLVIGATPVTGVWLYNFLLTLARGKDAPPLPPLDLVNLSHEDRPSAETFNRASLGRLASALGATMDAVRAAIAERNAVRAMQRRIEALRHGPGRRLTGTQARRLLDAGDQTPAQAYLASAAEAVTSAGSTTAPQDAVPVIYSGPGSPSLDLYAALEDRGVCVVGDDADYGTRAIGPDVAAEGDLISALAHRYASRTPAPAGWSTRARIDWLTELAVARGARAVIFDLPPWAHPAAWDFPAERRALQARGVACVLAPDGPPGVQAEAAVAALHSRGLMSAAHV